MDADLFGSAIYHFRPAQTARQTGDGDDGGEGERDKYGGEGGGVRQLVS